MPALRDVDGTVATTDIQKAEIIQSYFSSTYSNSPAQPSNFECDPSWLCDVDFIFRNIPKTPNKKSIGCDGISPIMFKNAAVAISPVLCTLVNKIMRNTVIPSGWKHSVVAPVPKVPSPSLVSDLRPVGLACASEKHFEKHLYSILSSFILPLLCNVQFGFQPKRGTVDALGYFQYKVMQYWLFCTTVACVYFDL